MASRGGTKSSPRGKTKTGGSEETVVYSASIHVPTVLANPLSVRAAVLRRPKLSEELAPEFVEEGDILFDVLANPLHHPSTLFSNSNGIQRRSKAAAFFDYGVGSSLSFPISAGKHFVGQQLRVFLSFHNAATYSLSSLVFLVECFHPTLQRTTLLNNECPCLDGKKNASFTVELLLRELGSHTLSVTVTYIDVVNETRRLTWSSSFHVERAITEVGRTLDVIHVAPRNRNMVVGQSLTAGDPAPYNKRVGIVLPKKKYVLSICLQNTSSMSLVILGVKLHTGDAFECLPPPRSLFQHNRRLPPLWWPGGVEAAEKDAESLCMLYNNGCNDALEDIHLQPRDKRCYYFEFAMKMNGVCSGGSHGESSGDTPAAALSKPMDIGYVSWEWQAVNGDGGTERSSILQLGEFLQQPMLELFVADVRPETPKAGDPVTLECVAINYDVKKSIDLALRVRPEKLTPAFVYAGQLMSPLGSVEPLGTLTFFVSLVPWQPGWAVVRGGLELCDAHAPATLLWPLPPAETKQLPPKNTQLLVRSDASKELYPPVLCEIFVC